MGVMSAASAVGGGAWGDVGDLHDGDEYYDDGSDFDSDDDEDDDAAVDDNDEHDFSNREDKGQEDGHDAHSGAATHSGSGSPQVATAAGTQLLTGVGNGLLGAATAPPQRAAPPAAQAGGSRAVPDDSSTVKNRKRGPEISEKEVLPGLSAGVAEEETAEKRARVLKKHRPFTPARIAMWMVMTVFPVFFIGKLVTRFLTAKKVFSFLMLADIDRPG